MLKLFRITRTTGGGYDTYDSAVVCAKSKQAAKRVHPSDSYEFDKEGYVVFKYVNGEKERDGKSSSCWCPLEDVEVEYIGVAGRNVKEGEVIVASFNAG